MINNNNQARVAVITGASSGIGEATARALATAGYRVAVLARRVDRITALADELGDGAIAIEADVTDRDSILAAAQRVQQELGGADVLVNNAGVMLLGPFDTGQRDDYRHMIEVNLLGAITATEVFLDQLKQGGAERGGDIVNISSVAGRTARAGNGVYAATKARSHWPGCLRRSPGLCLSPGPGGSCASTRTWDQRTSTSHLRTWQNSTARQPACRSRATATQKPCKG
jgi:NADP-dependent 3-hydroxy acid dehydrogenase YdfG